MRRIPFLLSCLCLAAPAAADVFEVTRGDDPEPNGCLAADCSLREALEAAQATPGSDVIQLGAGQHFVTRGDLDAYGIIVVEGAGRAATSIVGDGASSVLRVAAHSEFTLRDLEFVVSGGVAIAASGDSTSTTLERVGIPAGEVAAGNDGGIGDVVLRVRDSVIGETAACIAADGRCEISGSVVGTIGALGERVAVRVVHTETLGPLGGVIARTSGEVVIEDTTIRGARRPLELLQASGIEPADVHVRRTRFIGNSGPMRAISESMIWMDEVEFRDNVVSGASLSTGNPAVLLAEGGAAWRISRALFIGNRGGAALDGAVVRVLGGANVMMSQVTFIDNTFHPDAGGGFGHSIGVYAVPDAPTILWLFHATMRKAPSLPDGTQGSLLTARGPSANVRVFNSVMDGSCAFGGGGAMLQAIGNIESPGHGCGFDPVDNTIDLPGSDLLLGALADNGGFTQTYLPDDGSPLVDSAKSTYCSLSNLAFGATDQRTWARPADGVDCDIGAVESGSQPDRIFADGFGY